MTHWNINKNTNEDDEGQDQSVIYSASCIYLRIVSTALSYNSTFQNETRLIRTIKSIPFISGTEMWNIEDQSRNYH